jgi:hypothetical protein
MILTSIFVCFLAVSLHSASACAPGIPNSEEIISQLGAYLGIAPINGPTGATGSYISNAFEANCDLENVAMCRWQNLDNSANVFIDTEDFFLFSKTSDLAVGFTFLAPPGRQPLLGSQVILAGSQSSTGGSAIWHSDPLRCMQNDGELTFEYYMLTIPAEPAVQVMLLEPDTYSILYTSTEMCQAIAPLDGICRIKIPAQTVPFHIAIRVYELDNNFVILDNIQFTGTLGQLCDGSMDFGTTAVTDTFGATDTPVISSTDLTCSEFDANCRWTNDFDEPQWESHTGTVDPSKWAIVTGKWEVPSGDFLMVQAPSGSAPAALYSDQIKCQTGAGTLTFKAWMSDAVRMQACVVNADTLAVIQCHDVLRLFGPNYAYVFNGDLNNAKIQIVASDWGVNGGMAAVDNIQYVATMCETFMLAGPFTQSVLYQGIVPPSTITSNAELACSVDTATSCHWGIADPSHVWLWVNNVDPLKVQTLAGTSQMPVGGAAYYEFEDAGVTFFASDDLYCISGTGDLTFNVWVSAGVSLEICAVLPTENREKCHPESIVPSGPTSYTFYATEVGYAPLTFIITAYSTGPGFVMIDDLAFTGGVCSTPTEGPTEPPIDPDELECQLFSTTFTIPGTLGSIWHTGTQPLNDVRTRIYPLEPFQEIDHSIGRQNRIIDGPDNAAPFLGVEMTADAPASVLTSEPMLFGNDRFMSFVYQRGLSYIKIYICHNVIPALLNYDFPPDTPECDLIADYYNFNAAEYLNGIRSGTVVKATDSTIHIVAITPYGITSGTEAPLIIDDIRFHEGTTVDSPFLCTPLG